MKALSILAMLLPLWLAACASPPPDHRAPSQAVQAAPVALRAWLPSGEIEALVVAVHGFNDYSNAFDQPARQLAAAGIATFAFDLPGFGATPSRGEWAGEPAMEDDLARATRQVAARYPSKPLFILGESMGGALVMVTIDRADMPKLQGVILAAPAVWNRGSMTIFERSALWLLSHTMPWMSLSGSQVTVTPSDNVEMLRRLGRDPLVIKQTKVEAIDGLCDLMDDAARSASTLRLPALVLYGEQDQIVPAAPTYRMMKNLPGSRESQITAIYPHGYHMLLRDLQADIVLQDIVAWIKRPGQALPSGADLRADQLLG
jgi:alpha-beta hydrolase superfamily lysophospholipase